MEETELPGYRVCRKSPVVGFPGWFEELANFQQMTNKRSTLFDILCGRTLIHVSGLRRHAITQYNFGPTPDRDSRLALHLLAFIVPLCCHSVILEWPILVESRSKIDSIVYDMYRYVTVQRTHESSIR